MEELLKKFKLLTKEEKITFMKEAMLDLMGAFGGDPQKMMSEMMPFCMSMMKGMDMEKMRGMMKGMMG